MSWTSAQLAPWLAALKAGRPAAAPAEGLYGYCADPFNPAALEALLLLKQRSGAKGFITLVSSPAQLALLCPPLPPECESAVADCWQPGRPATTLVLPALPSLPRLLTGGAPTIAVRMPQVGYMQDYLKAWAAQGKGPLVSTSANVSGQPAATGAAQLDPSIPALTLPGRLSGAASRIFNPATNVWLR